MNQDNKELNNDVDNSDSDSDSDSDSKKQKKKHLVLHGDCELGQTLEGDGITLNIQANYY